MSDRNVNVNVSWGMPLGALLIILKVLGYITWAWWLVLLPIWLPWAVFGAILAVPLAIAGLVAAAVGILTAADWLWRKVKR